MKRRRLRWLLPAALVLAWVGYVLIIVIQAGSDLKSGRRTLDSTRKKATLASVIDGEPLPDLRRTRAKFERAHDRLSSAALLPVRVIPLVGRQVRSVARLADSAAGTLDVGMRAISEAQGILEGDLGDRRQRPTVVRKLSELAERTSQQLGEQEITPQDKLLPSIADARNEYTKELAEIRDGLSKAAVGGRAVADLLNGPRRYLLFAANNAEMRAGSGMFLSAAELLTDAEGVRLENVRSVTDIPVPPEAVALTGDLADRWGWLSPNQDWRNLMVSPRFDASATLAAQMWVASGGQPVDGVLALDPVALERLLEVTGPVSVDDRRISKDNVVKELLHDQYVRFPQFEEKPERREALGRIARAIFAALEERTLPAADLLDALADAARGRHLLIWSSRPEEQAGWEALGVHGGLRGDSLLVSVINRGGNKLDQYLDVSAELSSSTAGADTNEVTVRLHLANRVPAREAFYIAGPHPGTGLAEGEYLGLVTVNLPAGATGGRFDDVDSLAVAGADGSSRVIGFQVSLPRGAQRTVVARFRLPAQVATVRVEPSARVPVIKWTSKGRSWRDTSARTVHLAA